MVACLSLTVFGTCMPVQSGLLVCPNKYPTHFTEDAASWDGLAIQTVAQVAYIGNR